MLADDTVVIPDIVVARRSDLGEHDLPATPVLAVEVLSPSTARIDRWLKWARHEASGTTAYWIVDPAGAEITAWELVDGRFVEVGHAVARELLVLERPFPVSVVPTDLTGD